MEKLVAVILAGCSLVVALEKEPDNGAEAELLAMMQAVSQHLMVITYTLIWIMMERVN